MADLPMAQIPNFQLGAVPNNAPSVANAIQGVQGGGQQAIQAMQFQQQLAQQKQQQMIEKNMKMLETGSDMMLSGGPEVQQTGQALIQQAYPFLTGQPLPQGMPLDKDAAKDLGYFMDQHRKWQQTNGKEGLSAADAVTGATQAISRYGMKYQQQQIGLLEKTPMYKEGMANQVGGQVNGQPATQNEYTGNVQSPSGQPMPGAQGNFIPAGQAATMQDANTKFATTNFTDLTKDHQSVLPTVANALNLVAAPLPANADEQTKAEYAMNDKQAAIRYIEALVPQSKRLNMSIEDAASSGLAGEEAKTIFNKFTGKVPATEQDRSALVNSLANLAMTTEGDLSTIEKNSASKAIKNRVNPAQAFQNIRPPTIPSTSSLFPSQQVPSAQTQTGQIMKNPPDNKYYIFRGQTGTNDWKKKANWMPIK